MDKKNIIIVVLSTVILLLSIIFFLCIIGKINLFDQTNCYNKECNCYATTNEKIEKQSDNNQVEDVNENLNNQNNNGIQHDDSSNVALNDIDYYPVAKISYQSTLFDINNNYYTISVDNGKLNVNNNSFDIDNESIIYFYVTSYQCSGNTVFHFLTQNGNIYVINYESYNKGIEQFNNFIKLPVSNVSDIVVLANEHYGKTFDNDTSGIKDNKKYFLYAISDGKNIKLDYQYHC